MKKSKDIFLVTLGLLIFSLSGFAQSLKDARKIYQKPMSEYRQAQNDKRKIERMSRSREKKVSGDDSETGDTVFWKDFRYVPSQGSLAKHRKTFLSLHGEQTKLFLNKNNQYKGVYYDTLLNTYYANTGRSNELSGEYDVLGWVPGYDSSKVVQFETGLLSIASYNFLQFNPYTGTPREDQAFRSLQSGICDSLRKGNKKLKVIINVYMPHPDELSVFLSQAFTQSYLIEEVAKLVKESKADGIEISFGRPLLKDSTALNDFILRFAGRIKGGDTSKLVVVSMDPYLEETPYNVPLLYGNIDRFVIKAFDYVDTYNQVPGPFAPLNTISNNHNINKSIFKYFITHNLRPEKCILALPLQAPIWETSPEKILSNNQADFTLIDFLDYWDFKSAYEPRYENPNFDYVSGSSYYLSDQEGKSSLVWFEGKTSLDLKFKWVKENDLAGVGLWELSAAGNYQEVSDLVSNNFGKDSLVAISPIALKNDGLYGFMDQLSSHRKNIAAGVVILLGFIFLAILYSFFDWRIREIFFKNYDYRVIIALIFIVLSAIPASLFLVDSGAQRLSANYEEFKTLVDKNELLVKDVKFTIHREVSSDSLAALFGKIKEAKSEQLARDFDTTIFNKKERYIALIDLRKHYEDLSAILDNDDKYGGDSLYRLNVQEQLYKVNLELEELRAYASPLTESELKVKRQYEYQMALNKMMAEIEKSQTDIKAGQSPKSMVEFETAEISVQVTNGDEGWEDFFEILCSAVAGAFIMYLVSLIYFKRRQNLP